MDKLTKTTIVFILLALILLLVWIFREDFMFEQKPGIKSVPLNIPLNTI